MALRHENGEELLKATRELSALVSRVSPDEDSSTVHFIIGVASEAAPLGASAASVAAIKDALSNLVQPAHRALLNQLVEALSLDSKVLGPEARKEIGAGGFHSQEDIEALGVVCFLSEFVVRDALGAQMLLKLGKMTPPEVQHLRADIESMLKETMRFGSAWGEMLERVADGSRNTFEKLLIRGFLDVYIDLQASQPSALDLLKRVFSGGPTIKDQPFGLNNPNLEQLEIKFLESLIAAFHNSRKSSEEEARNQRERERLEQERMAGEAISLATEQAKAAEANRAAAEALREAAVAAEQIVRLRSGEMPSKIKLEDLPDILKVVINVDPAGAISECTKVERAVLYGNTQVAKGHYFASADEIAITYANFDKMRERDGLLRFNDEAAYDELHAKWENRIREVAAYRMVLEIPPSLAFEIRKLDSKEYLNQILEQYEDRWFIITSGEVKDNGWGKMKFGELRESDYGYGYSLDCDEYKKTYVLSNIVVNLLVQAAEKAGEPAVARMP